MGPHWKNRAMHINVSRPSILLMFLSRMVKSGFLPRGYGWVLRNTPSFIWGGRNIKMKTDAGDMVFPLDDPGCTGMLLFGRILHEERESVLVEKFAAGCCVMFDIGSNTGWYSILMWRGMKGKGRVFAIEPNPRTLLYLQENTVGRAGIYPFGIVMSDSNKKIPFYCSKSSNLSSSVRNVGEEVTVEGMSVDEFCYSCGVFESVDFIKCDVEGSELKVLRGARNLRSAGNSPVWMIEVDELFLEQAGTSANEIMKEIFRPEFGVIRLYYLDQYNKSNEIGHVGERKGTNNVFIVPEARTQQFLQATE